jgi:hypothetical protein
MAEDDLFLTNDTPLIIPFFETVNLSMSNKFTEDDEDYWEIYLDATTQTPEWD